MLHKARYGEGVWSFHALSQSTPPSPNLHVFTKPEALQTPSFGFLWRLPYRGALDSISGHWWLIQLLSPPLNSGGWVWKAQHPNHMVGPFGNQPPNLWCFPKSLINKKHLCSHQRKLQEFREFCTMHRGENQICISYYKSQYPTISGDLARMFSHKGTLSHQPSFLAPCPWLPSSVLILHLPHYLHGWFSYYFSYGKFLFLAIFVKISLLPKGTLILSF